MIDREVPDVYVSLKEVYTFLNLIADEAEKQGHETGYDLVGIATRDAFRVTADAMVEKYKKGIGDGKLKAVTDID